MNEWALGSVNDQGVWKQGESEEIICEIIQHSHTYWSVREFIKYQTNILVSSVLGRRFVLVLWVSLRIWISLPVEEAGVYVIDLYFLLLLSSMQISLFSEQLIATI